MLCFERDIWEFCVCVCFRTCVLFICLPSGSHEVELSTVGVQPSTFFTSRWRSCEEDWVSFAQSSWPGTCHPSLAGSWERITVLTVTVTVAHRPGLCAMSSGSNESKRPCWVLPGGTACSAFHLPDTWVFCVWLLSYKESFLLL